MAIAFIITFHISVKDAVLVFCNLSLRAVLRCLPRACRVTASFQSYVNNIYLKL